MSVYKRKESPFYYFRFELDGRKFHGSTERTSRRDAEAVERDKREKAKAAFASAVSASERPTVDQVFARYWKTEGHKKSGAKYNVQDHMEEVILLWGSNRLYDSITTKDISNVLEAYAATGVSDATVNRRMALLRKIHNKARDEWEINVQPIHWKKHKRKEAKERVRFLTVEEAQRLLKILPDHIRLMVIWSLVTGCRLNETETLIWSRVTHKAAEVATKGGGTRFIQLGPDAHAILGMCDRGRLYVFDNTNRRKIWEQALKDAGIEDFRWHDLRHTYATWLGHGGAGLHVIQKALGHAQINTTMRYAHAVVEDVQRANSNLPTLIEGKVQPLKRKGE